MLSEKEAFNKIFLLTCARVFGIVFALLIPMYLGRSLAIETYGTYKQIMLFFWFSQVALNLGLDDAAFYFFRWDPKKLSLYSFNALVFNLSATGLLWVLMVVFKVELARLIGNPEMIRYFPMLGFLILASVSSMQIEGILIVGLNNFKARLYVEMGTELLKSLAILAAFYFYQSIDAVLLFLSLIMTSRLLVTIIIINKNRIKEELSFYQSRHYFMSQLKFGLPLGLSRVLQNILNMENFYISSIFSLVQFTYYSVGCFENPLINAARASVFEMMNIEIVEAVKRGSHEQAVEIWKSMNRKLLLFVVPFVFYMIFFAKEIILFIFSSKYLQSVPFFMDFNLYLLVGAINPEPIFRATSSTHHALKIKIAGLILGVSLLIAGAHFGGPIFALVGKILGILMMNIFGLYIGAKLLDTNILKLFRWREIFKITIVSLFLSICLRFVFWNSPLNVFLILSLSFSTYVLFHFVISCWFEIIKEDEIAHLKVSFMALVSKGKLILRLI